MDRYKTPSAWSLPDRTVRKDSSDFPEASNANASCPHGRIPAAGRTHGHGFPESPPSATKQEQSQTNPRLLKQPDQPCIRSGRTQRPAGITAKTLSNLRGRPAPTQKQKNHEHQDSVRNNPCPCVLIPPFRIWARVTFNLIHGVPCQWQNRYLTCRGLLGWIHGMRLRFPVHNPLLRTRQ